jgi:hypothetical protein
VPNPVQSPLVIADSARIRTVCGYVASRYVRRLRQRSSYSSSVLQWSEKPNRPVHRFQNPSSSRVRSSAAWRRSNSRFMLPGRVEGPPTHVRPTRRRT